MVNEEGHDWGENNGQGDELEARLRTDQFLAITGKAGSLCFMQRERGDNTALACSPLHTRPQCDCRLVAKKSTVQSVQGEVVDYQEAACRQL